MDFLNFKYNNKNFLKIPNLQESQCLKDLQYYHENVFIHPNLPKTNFEQLIKLNIKDKKMFIYRVFKNFKNFIHLINNFSDQFWNAFSIYQIYFLGISFGIYPVIQKGFKVPQFYLHQKKYYDLIENSKDSAPYILHHHDCLRNTVALAGLRYSNTYGSCYLNNFYIKGFMSKNYNDIVLNTNIGSSEILFSLQYNNHRIFNNIFNKNNIHSFANIGDILYINSLPFEFKNWEDLYDDIFEKISLYIFTILSNDMNFLNLQCLHSLDFDIFFELIKNEVDELLKKLGKNLIKFQSLKLKDEFVNKLLTLYRSNASKNTIIEMTNYYNHLQELREQKFKIYFDYQLLKDSSKHPSSPLKPYFHCLTIIDKNNYGCIVTNIDGSKVTKTLNFEYLNNILEEHDRIVLLKRE